jgi:hypothetical protein
MASFFGSLLGDDQASASRDAARDTFNKQRAATDEIKAYGDQYAGKFADMSHQYDPYIAAGGQGVNALTRLLQDPSSLRSLPGYQFAQGEGVQALDRGAAAHGMLNSGRGSKDLLRFGTGLADKTYGDQLARLMGVSQFGVGANGAQIGTVGQGLQGQMGTRQSAYGGDMTAANTIGLGDIAAANAKAAGAKNILDTGMKGIGMVAGASSYGGGYGGGQGANSLMNGGAGAGYDQYGRRFG